MASSTATLDFGTHPGSGHAKVVVSGQTNLLTTSRIEAWLEPVDTADHKHDEHIVAPIHVVAGNKVVGTSFTIHGYVMDFGGQSEDHGPGGRGFTRAGRTARRMWGRWNAAWASDYT